MKCIISRTFEWFRFTDFQRIEEKLIFVVVVLLQGNFCALTVVQDSTRVDIVAWFFSLLVFFPSFWWGFSSSGQSIFRPKSANANGSQVSWTSYGIYFLKGFRRINICCWIFKGCFKQNFSVQSHRNEVGPVNHCCVTEKPRKSFEWIYVKFPGLKFCA